MKILRRLTSKKTKVIYIFVYIIYSILYIIHPIAIMRFIDNIVIKDTFKIIIYASISGGLFILFQIISYWFSTLIGKVESENFVNFFNRVNIVVKNQDMRKNEITLPELTQHIGQYYDLANRYFFIEKVEFVFSIINIVTIFIIMFLIDWRISLILLLFVPVSFLISKKFEKKLFLNSEKNLKNNDNIKSFILDQNTLTKEERFASEKQLYGFDKILNIYKPIIKEALKQNRRICTFFPIHYLILLF